MPNIAAVLRQEITRLARKETRTQTDALRKANAQYRRDIAQLKRQVDALSRQVAYLEQQERKRASSGVPAADVEGRRFSAARLRARREKLGLSAAAYARLIGVTAQTIYNWEQGKSRPGEEQLARLVGVRRLGKREILRRLELLDH